MPEVADARRGHHHAAAVRDETSRGAQNGPGGLEVLEDLDHEDAIGGVEGGKRLLGRAGVHLDIVAQVVVEPVVDVGPAEPGRTVTVSDRAQDGTCAAADLDPGKRRARAGGGKRGVVLLAAGCGDRNRPCVRSGPDARSGTFVDHSGPLCHRSRRISVTSSVRRQLWRLWFVIESECVASADRPGTPKRATSRRWRSSWSTAGPTTPATTWTLRRASRSARGG